MNNKRLSIIIPFYNVEQYIAQCLDSVYHQDIPEEEYEVICVDDCSPDNSISIVEEYAKNHINMILVRNQYNRKLGGARNAGIDVATGQYIWFVDSDDFVEKNCFQKLLVIAESEDLDVLHFNYSQFPESTISKKKSATTPVMTGPDLFFNPNFVWYDDLITAWGKLYKRVFLLNNNIHFAEHIMFEDNDYAIEVWAKARKVKHTKINAYFYRNNPESITRTKYTSVHITYWLDLCHRLNVLQTKLNKEERDKRFHRIISNFIKYILENVMNVYKCLENNYKQESYYVISNGIDTRLLPYIPLLKYIKIKLGLYR